MAKPLVQSPMKKALRLPLSVNYCHFKPMTCVFQLVLYLMNVADFSMIKDSR